jgi:hypothetical protein
MAVFLNNGVVLTVNAVDLSDHVTSVTINRSFDELEVTAMGDSGHKFVKGLTAKQTSEAVSAANPLYTMSCLINNTTDINGSVADLSAQSLTFNVNGTIAVTTS